MNMVKILYSAAQTSPCAPMLMNVDFHSPISFVSQ